MSKFRQLTRPFVWLLVCIPLFVFLSWVYRPDAPVQAAIPGAISSGPTPCVDGMAGIYPCDKVDMLAFMSLSDLGGGAETQAANLWGWTDPLTNKEYLVQGLTDAAAFVDVTDAENPIYLGKLPTHTTSATYRDIKIYKDHAFIIADVPSEHGMQVFDLTQLRDVTSPPVTFAETAHYGEFGNGHNLFINEETGYAYVLRTSQCTGSLYMIDVNEPTAPEFAGCFADDGLASDTMCVVYHGPDADYQAKEICVTSSDDSIVVGDVTDKSAPVHLARLTYLDVSRAHHAWLTADHHYFLSADMHDELHEGHNTRIFVWDLSDVDAPVLVGNYLGPTTAADHNVWIRDDLAYVGNFRAGLRILDISGIATADLTQAGFFDMYPADDNPEHGGGAWAAYPYFASGVIAVSDKEQGLFLLQPTLEPTDVGISGFSGESDQGSLLFALLLLLSLIVGIVIIKRSRSRNRPAA